MFRLQNINKIKHKSIIFHDQKIFFNVHSKFFYLYTIFSQNIIVVILGKALWM